MMLRWLVAALVVVVIGWLGLGFVKSHRSMFGACVVDPGDHAGLLTSSGGPRTVKVLFVGDSLTSANDLPGTLVKVASSDPESPVKLAVGSNTKTNANLSQLYDDGCALRRLRAEHFDIVVLQEHGRFWFTPLDVLGAQLALGNWANAVRKAGSAPEYFEPWVDGPGVNPAFRNVDALASVTDDNARTNSVPVVRVGEAFAEVVNTPGAPGLYQADRHHPSAAGTYLAALILFHHFTGEPGERASWRPDGVSADQAALLARIGFKY